MLTVAEITVRFDDRPRRGSSTPVPPVLERFTMTVATGEVVALLGPSGSGKSTLLRVIAGLLVPESGSITLDGEDLGTTPTHRRGIGMVFQDEQLFPHRDVARNIAFGLEMTRVDRTQRQRRVAEMLDLVGLPDFGHRSVADLSGGEAKRVAVARALAPAPRVLLLDEPLTGLDRELHDRLAVEVAAILRRAGTTAIWVTHDLQEASVVADRIIELSPSTPRSSSPAAGYRAGDEHP